MRQGVVGVDLEAQFLQVGQGIPVVVGDGELGVAEAVHEDVQRPLGGAGRVQLSQGAGRGVSGVGVGRQVSGRPLFVELLELRLGEVHLASDLEGPGRDLFEHSQRYAFDGAKVQRDVLSDDPVTPGGAADEDAVLVGQGDGQAVVLELAHHVEVVGLQQVRCPGVPRHELLVVEGVGQAEQRDQMLDFGEPLGGLGPHSLRGRIGRNQLGMLLLQPAKLVHQRVVPGVADLRLIEHVVQVIVPVQLLSEGFYPFWYVCACHRAAVRLIQIV